MIKPKLKIGSNVQQNFKTSPEINAWSVKYNTPIPEIQHIFESTGNSIARTLEILREREQTGK